MENTAIGSITQGLCFFIGIAQTNTRYMQIDAMAVANYFIELSNNTQENNRKLDILGLLKRVYIAHGFSLALLDKPLLNERFDKVEAWRYGPVIPSVYHTFKHHGKSIITEPATIIEWDDNTGEMKTKSPELDDEDAKKMCDIVWSRYQNYSGLQLVELLHQRGTPWDLSYRAGTNCPIPDELTKKYYSILVKHIRDGKA